MPLAACSQNFAVGAGKISDGNLHSSQLQLPVSDALGAGAMHLDSVVSDARKAGLMHFQALA